VTKDHLGTWEARARGRDSVDAGREDITGLRLTRESEGSIVAMKRPIPVEQRDPTENMLT
jgi:hypothetical protein